MAQRTIHMEHARRSVPLFRFTVRRPGASPAGQGPVTQARACPAGLHLRVQ